MTDNKAIILTVDDDPIILNAIMTTLSQDYIVRPFTSGETALKFLAKNSADLILLDYYMPNMTGFDVLRSLQADQRLREIPVIFLTGSVDSDDEVESLEMGAMDYLLKPIKPKSLLTRVRLQLELQRHRHHLEALVNEKTQQLQQSNRKLAQRDKITLNLLARASDMRDHDTGTHIFRTTGFARVLVEDLLARPKEGYQISVAEGQDIVEATKLHDLGKIAIPDAVLLKPGKLTPEEFEIIKMHPVYGEDMLHDAVKEMGEDSLLLTARDIAYGHHEKWNGSGYPRGISGAEIPLSARIAAIADVFDALTSTRPYKEPFPPAKAFAIIYADSGAHFDPYLVEIVRRHEADFESVLGCTD
ncbi:MAG: response regulator [Gracilibacteraceae bacterium]|jgi:putative two-component system response regulator|nr:response regulator [Gracilibacteraceae bacterium]